MPECESSSGKCIRKYESCLNHGRCCAGYGRPSPPDRSGSRRCCRAAAARNASKTCRRVEVDLRMEDLWELFGHQRDTARLSRRRRHAGGVGWTLELKTRGKGEDTGVRDGATARPGLDIERGVAKRRRLVAGERNEADWVASGFRLVANG